LAYPVQPVPVAAVSTALDDNRSLRAGTRCGLVGMHWLCGGLSTATSRPVGTSTLARRESRPAVATAFYPCRRPDSSYCSRQQRPCSLPSPPTRAHQPQAPPNAGDTVSRALIMEGSKLPPHTRHNSNRLIRRTQWRGGTQRTQQRRTGTKAFVDPVASLN
jgi:hypothetical protein